MHTGFRWRRAASKAVEAGLSPSVKPSKTGSPLTVSTLDDAGIGSSSPFPACAFRLTARFGANVSYSLAAIPLSPDESWQALHCTLCAGPTC